MQNDSINHVLSLLLNLHFKEKVYRVEDRIRFKVQFISYVGYTNVYIWIEIREHSGPPYLP